MLTPIADDLWCVAIPHTFIGLNFGARMTIIRLPDGSLLLYSPVPMDDALAGEIDQLGPVKHIVAPNLFHHLYVSDAHARWPDAEVSAPAGLDKKRPDLTIHRTLGVDALPDGVVGVSLAGMAPLSETVIHHPASRSLLTCDLILNITAPKGWWTKLYLSLNGINGTPGVSKVVAKSAFKDHAALRGSLDAVLDLDFDRLIIAHGDILETGGRDVLREGFAWMK